jgi:hypothetical protein
MSSDVREFGSRRTNSGVALTSKVIRRFDQEFAAGGMALAPDSLLPGS